MRTVARINADGLFACDVLLGDGQEMPPNHVESRPPEGFHAPKWTGSAWTEGKSQAERLAAAKEAKRAELAWAFVAANTTLYSETAPEYAIWLAVPEYAATPNGQRPQAIRANIARYRERLVAVNAAATEADVEGVVW